MIVGFLSESPNSSRKNAWIMQISLAGMKFLLENFLLENSWQILTGIPFPTRNLLSYQEFYFPTKNLNSYQEFHVPTRNSIFLLGIIFKMDPFQKIIICSKINKETHSRNTIILLHYFHQNFKTIFKFKESFWKH